MLQGLKEVVLCCELLLHCCSSDYVAGWLVVAVQRRFSVARLLSKQQSLTLSLLDHMKHSILEVIR